MSHTVPVLFLLGILILFSYFAGKGAGLLRLPAIIGYMLIGVIIGPSGFDFITDSMSEELSFVTNIALGFVAVSIGLELNLSSLARHGKGIIAVILAESLAAFLLVGLVVYLITGNLPMSLIFGAIAPASAPAGTVAIIREFKARGKLTKVLYAVVGFDDGFGIILFGFTFAVAKTMIGVKTGNGESVHLTTLILSPLYELLLSIAAGIGSGFVFSIIGRKISNKSNLLIILTGTVFITCGLSEMFHLSVILTNMVFGMFVINTSSYTFSHSTGESISIVMPLLFTLFFGLAGTSLHISALPTLGVLGTGYIIARSSGLIGGSILGGMIGRIDKKIRYYIGLGILSQAGVAIGLSLAVRNELSVMGEAGVSIGNTVITTITATCIIFEIIGPVLTRVALSKAGEIDNLKK